MDSLFYVEIMIKFQIQKRVVILYFTVTLTHKYVQSGQVSWFERLRTLFILRCFNRLLKETKSANMNIFRKIFFSF